MTDQEKQELKQEIITQIKSESQDVTDLEQVSSLDGINTLPAMRGATLVVAPVGLLSKPATDAASQALSAKAAAESAAATALTAAVHANETAEAAQAAAEEANTAKAAAEEATQAAESVSEQYEYVAVSARNGATSRFYGISYLEEEIWSSSPTDVKNLPVWYNAAYQVFYVRENGVNYGAFPEVGMYTDSDHLPLKNKLYMLGDTLYIWSEQAHALVEASGTGGGNTINVTETYPLDNGFYTLATAIKAVEDKKRVKGACVTFEVSQGKWQTKQFVGTSLSSWESESSWDDFGGGGTVKSVTLNGQKKTPDAQGNIDLTVDEVTVDASLDAQSTNPVENRAVAGKFSEIESATLFDSDVEEGDDGTQTVTLKNKSGAAITQFTLAAGGGGGGGDTQATKIVLGASVNQGIIKEGGNCVLTWNYDHQYTSGDDAGQTTGQKATVEIRVLRGSILAYSVTTEDVSKGTYTLDVSKYLQVGTTDIYVKATTTDPTTGKTQTKQAYANVKVVNLSLNSSYSLSSGLSSGGYGPTESAVIPYTVQGTGTKVVTLYVDGSQYETATVTRSGTTNGSFTIPMSDMGVGRHTVQLVAEMEASADLTLRSESIYMDIYKAGSSAPLIGTKHTFKDGRIFTTNHRTPRLAAGQYEQLTFE